MMLAIKKESGCLSESKLAPFADSVDMAAVNCVHALVNVSALVRELAYGWNMTAENLE